MTEHGGKASILSKILRTIRALVMKGNAEEAEFLFSVYEAIKENEKLEH